MANLFAHLHMEDRTADFPEGALITEGDEGESVAAAIAEATEEEAGVVEAENEMDDLVEGEETASDLVDAVEEAPKTESAGLTTTNARLLSKVLKHLGGAATAKSLMPKMEHFDGRASRRDATQLVMEGIKDSLKNFWEALKRQFQKVWAKLKTWYVKTFSAAKRIADRAKTIRDRAEGMSATIDKKSFQFGQAKQLVVGGNLKSASAFESAFNRVIALVEGVTDVPTDAQLDNLADSLDGYGKTDNKLESIAAVAMEEVFGKLGNKIGGGAAGTLDSKVAASLGEGDGGNAQTAASDVLPGDKQLVFVTSKDNKDTNAILRMCRIVFVNTKDKPKEIDGNVDVVTLNASQVANFCDQITSAAGSIADYEAKWQKVDKAQEHVLRKLDELTRDALNDVKDNDNADSKDERAVRTLCTNVTNFTKRVANMPGQINSYAMGIFGATLNWCEGSMRNYKK